MVSIKQCKRPLRQARPHAYQTNFIFAVTFTLITTTLQNITFTDDQRWKVIILFTFISIIIVGNYNLRCYLAWQKLIIRVICWPHINFSHKCLHLPSVGLHIHTCLHLAVPAFWPLHLFNPCGYRFCGLQGPAFMSLGNFRYFLVYKWWGKLNAVPKSEKCKLLGV